jgi:hypothetical protein
MPDATRLTRATGDCLRDERLVDVFFLVLRLLVAPVRPLFAVLFLRAEDVLRGELLALRLLAELLRVDDLRAVVLRVVRFRVVLPAPPLRALAVRERDGADLRAADFLRGAAADLDDLDAAPAFEPVRRLLLLRDDFLVAML